MTAARLGCWPPSPCSPSGGAWGAGRWRLCPSIVSGNSLVFNKDSWCSFSVKCLAHTALGSLPFQPAPPVSDLVPTDVNTHNCMQTLCAASGGQVGGTSGVTRGSCLERLSSKKVRVQRKAKDFAHLQGCLTDLIKKKKMKWIKLDNYFMS